MRPSRQASSDNPGFVLMPRDLIDHPAFGDRKRNPFCRYAAFCWLVQQAAHRPTTISSPHGPVELERGQCSYSIRFLMNAWGWSYETVRRYVGALTKEGFIASLTHRVSNGSASGSASGSAQLIITICNYEQYQASSEISGSATGSAKESAAGQIRIKESREESPLSPPKGEQARNRRRVRTPVIEAAATPSAPSEEQREATRRRDWFFSLDCDPTMRVKLEIWVKTGNWRSSLPPPGDPGCRLGREVALAAVAERQRRARWEAENAEPAPTAAPPVTAPELAEQHQVAAATPIAEKPPPARAKPRRPAPPGQAGLLLPLAGGANREVATATDAATTARPPARGPPEEARRRSGAR